MDLRLCGASALLATQIYVSYSRISQGHITLSLGKAEYIDKRKRRDKERERKREGGRERERGSALYLLPWGIAVKWSNWWKKEQLGYSQSAVNINTIDNCNLDEHCLSLEINCHFLHPPRTENFITQWVVPQYLLTDKRDRAHSEYDFPN